LRVLLHPKAAEYLRASSEDHRSRTRQRLRELEDQPERRGKRLKHSPYYSLRVGDYRAIYTMDHEEDRVVVLFVGHRKDVNDDFDKIF
jgi:mRNA-degrading endonuclease RelE of RelBE toxin-antitoxin system